MGLLSKAAQHALRSGEMFGRGGPLKPELMYGGFASVAEQRAINRALWLADIARSRGRPVMVREEFVPFEDAVAIQSQVNGDFLDSYVRNTRLPQFVRKGGKIYLADGYHRAAREAAFGRNGIRGEVLNL